MQYDFIINNDRLFRAKRNNVYTGNVNYYECDFTFKASDDELTTAITVNLEVR